MAFGAAVTSTKGSDDCAGAGARDPHPASSIPASNMACNVFLMRYGEIPGTVLDGVKVADGVAVAVDVAVGWSVAVEVAVGVLVGKLGTIVAAGIGVRVEILGTHSSCPA